MQELAARLAESNRQRDQMKKYMEWQQDQLFKTLPPDQAKAYKDQLEESRKFRKEVEERYSGPCQPLEPMD